jgi:muconolactone delta-isomerase
MKILALEKESAQARPADFQPLLADEAAKVYELLQAGVVREVYFHATDHTAVLMLECVDADEARQTLDELPLVKAGLIDFDVVPLVPYTGFGRLFK